MTRRIFQIFPWRPQNPKGMEWFKEFNSRLPDELDKDSGENENFQ